MPVLKCRIRQYPGHFNKQGSTILKRFSSISEHYHLREMQELNPIYLSDGKEMETGVPEDFSDWEINCRYSDE